MEEVERPPIESASDTAPFEPSEITKLPSMSLEQLINIEEKLAREFSTLSKDYLLARKSRLEFCIRHAQEQINAAQLHDQKWAAIYTAETKKIETLNNALENHILKKRPHPLGDDELEDLLSHIESPLSLDDLFVRRKSKLPFATYFERMITPYETQLNAFKNENKYQSNLIDQNVRRYKLITWRQYRRDIVEHRRKLIEDTCQELNDLYEEYHGVKANKLATEDWSKYFRSVVPVTDMGSEGLIQKRLKRDNIDSYYDIDNPFYKKNKIRLTKIKSDSLQELGHFELSQQSQSIPQCESANVKLASCSGLSRSEVDDDLLILRQAKSVKDEYKVDAPRIEGHDEGNEEHNKDLS